MADGDNKKATQKLEAAASEITHPVPANKSARVFVDIDLKELVTRGVMALLADDRSAVDMVVL